MTVAIVIPAYNEATTISDVINQVRHAGDVIVVDDASDDNTAEIAQTSGATVVKHDFNKGYDCALQSGFERADEIGANFVITFDADGQHDPNVLTAIVNDLKNSGVLLVLGTRPTPARVAEALFNYWTNSRFGVVDILCGLKGYNMKLYRQLGYFDRKGSIGTELALHGLRGGYDFSTIAVSISERKGKARFGSLFNANMRIFRAFARAVWNDLRS